LIVADLFKSVLVVGTKNSGKSSFISLLNHSLATRSSKRDAEEHPPQKKGNFTSAYLETELEGERIGLTLWDSAGLEKSIVDLQLREMTSFIESKFEETFAEEQKVMRSPGFRDTHIHCVFLVLDPLKLDANLASAQQSNGNISGSRVGGLDDDVDVQLLRALWEKTVVIPVIAKADTLTTQHMAHLKRAVWRSIKDNSMNPLDALELEDDEADDDRYNEDSDVLPEGDGDSGDLASNSSDSSTEAKSKRISKRASLARHASQAGVPTDEEPYLPLSVLSPDPYTLPKSGHATEHELSRVFPWGSASPLNPQHCDFPRLRDSVFLEWRTDLRELSRARWYEQWRTSRLRNIPGTKMRIKGGVTPVAAVPREGRGDVRNFSSGGVGSGGVPRSVSGATQSTGGAGPTSVGMALGSPTAAA
jgi:septin family protein